MDLLEQVIDCQRDTPIEFVKRHFPNELPRPHHELILRAIHRASMGPVRMCISMPPGSAKTTTICRGLAWWMRRYQQDTHAYVTYGSALSTRNSAAIRAMVSSRDLGGPIIEQDTTAYWKLAKGGSLSATGVGGPLTGARIYGALVIDDPYKNDKDANSPAWQREVNQWFNTVAVPRMTKASSIIVVHTRWNRADLIERLATKEGFEHINVPALGADGKSYWEEAYSTEYLEGVRKTIGPYNFDALYMGNPRERGSKLFGEPRFHERSPIDGWTVFIGADPAASTKSSADYSVAVAVAVKGDHEMREARILDVLRGQWTVPDFARRLREFQRKWYGAPVGVESVSGFKAVPQILREMDQHIRVVEIVPTGDKFQRAQAVASAWNDGRISLPGGTAWGEAFVAELTSFTGINDEHDDQVDALSHAWNMARGQAKPLRIALAGS